MMIHDVLQFHAWCYIQLKSLKSQIKRWRKKPQSNLNIGTMAVFGRSMYVLQTRHFSGDLNQSAAQPLRYQIR